MDNQSQHKRSLTHAKTEVKKSKRLLSTDVLAKVGHTRKKVSSASKGISSNLQKKSAQIVQNTSLNKREFVLKFVKDSSSLVWPREMKIVNTIISIFPDDTFWRSLELKFKLNSLCWFLSDDGRKFLNAEYKKFKFEPEQPKSFDLKDNNIEFEVKKDDNAEKIVSVREFLKLWQKKN
jgi:hypothetical protein